MSTCSIVGSQIVSFSRIGLHQQMMEILSHGGKIFATNTDSITWTIHKDVAHFFNFSPAFGGIHHEVPGKIVEYSSLGKKCYSFSYLCDETNQIKKITKIRGLSLSSVLSGDITQNFDDYVDLFLKNKIFSTKVLQERRYLHKETLQVKRKLKEHSFTNNLYSHRIYFGTESKPIGFQE